MISRISRRLRLLAPVLMISLTLHAQSSLNKDWSAQKIKGTRFIPYVAYLGFPFLNSRWVTGKVVFADGEVSDTLNLRYSSYRDVVVYYNHINKTQIIIDKADLSGFSFKEKDGHGRTFKRLYYDGFGKGDRFFEVLAEGNTELLCYRKVNLIGTSVYEDKDGIMKNLMYSPSYSYYFYSPEKGFLPVKLNFYNLLSKFDKVQQKSIKKILRKKRIRIFNEETFVNAWKAIAEEGYQVKF